MFPCNLTRLTNTLCRPAGEIIWRSGLGRAIPVPLFWQFLRGTVGQIKIVATGKRVPITNMPQMSLGSPPKRNAI